MGGFIGQLIPLAKGIAQVEDRSLAMIRILNGKVYLQNAEGMKFNENNSISFENNLRLVSNQYGTVLLVWPYGDEEPEHTGLTGNYDHTGGTYERLLTSDTAVFTQTDANNNNIIITSDCKSAIITDYISTTQVIVHGFGWDSDITSMTFNILKAPSVALGDKYHSYFNVDSYGCFCLYSFGYAGGENHKSIFQINADMANDDIGGMLLNISANGYNRIDGIVMNYNTGDLQPGDESHCLHINLNESNADSADNTTDIDCMIFTTTDVSDAKKHAIHVLPGFDDALQVSGALPADPEYGYEVTGTTVVDRVNSGGTGDDAFVNNAVNQTILDNDNDYILIGSDNTFEAIQVILHTLASIDLTLEFYYSVGGGVYTEFYPLDLTKGFTESGFITWNASELTGWAKDDEAEVDTDITNAYYIKIKRTKNNVVTLPKELYFKIYASLQTGMAIRGDGTILPVSIADTDAQNNSIYYSTTQSALVYKDSGGDVYTFDMTIVV